MAKPFIRKLYKCKENTFSDRLDFYVVGYFWLFAIQSEMYVKLKVDLCT
jgi:hypothetical protein